MTLDEARTRARQLGGRLPNLRELSSLLTLQRQSGDWARINGVFFPKHTRSSLVWTDEGSLTSVAMLRYLVDFSDGTMRKGSSDDRNIMLVILEP